MEWKTSMPPNEKALLFQVDLKGLKGGTLTHLGLCDDYGYMVELEDHCDLGWAWDDVSRWVLLSELLAIFKR